MMSNARSAGRRDQTPRWRSGSWNTGSPAFLQTSMPLQRSAKRSQGPRNASSSKLRETAMLSNGLSEDDLFSFLSSQKKEDIDHRYILSSMCTLPHPVAVKAHSLFMETNLGDPGLFPGTASLERLLVERLGTLFHHKDAGGYATSGGTESNIQALRLAKVLRPSTCPNVVVPESAHFSFKKACDLLCLEIRNVPLGPDRRMHADTAAGFIDGNTICLVGVAGTTEYGMVIPFLERPIPFDFALPGVTTIAVDPHKMGMSTIPAGVLLTREPDMLDALNIDTPYLTVKREYTLAGTRPGAPVAGALAVLDYMGISGMKAVVVGCMKNTERLIAGMATLGI